MGGWSGDGLVLRGLGGLGWKGWGGVVLGRLGGVRAGWRGGWVDGGWLDRLGVGELVVFYWKFREGYGGIVGGRYGGEGGKSRCRGREFLVSLCSIFGGETKH